MSDVYEKRGVWYGVKEGEVQGFPTKAEAQTYQGGAQKEPSNPKDKDLFTADA